MDFRLRSIFFLSIILILIFYIVHGNDIPSQLLCLEKACNRPFARAELISSYLKGEVSLDKGTKVDIVGRSAVTANSMKKIIHNGRYHYIDQSFLKDLIEDKETFQKYPELTVFPNLDAIMISNSEKYLSEDINTDESIKLSTPKTLKQDIPRPELNSISADPLSMASSHTKAVFASSDSGNRSPKLSPVSQSGNIDLALESDFKDASSKSIDSTVFGNDNNSHVDVVSLTPEKLSNRSVHRHIDRLGDFLEGNKDVYLGSVNQGQYHRGINESEMSKISNDTIKLALNSTKIVPDNDSSNKNSGNAISKAPLLQPFEDTSKSPNGSSSVTEFETSLKSPASTYLKPNTQLADPNSSGLKKQEFPQPSNLNINMRDHGSTVKDKSEKISEHDDLKLLSIKDYDPAHDLPDKSSTSIKPNLDTEIYESSDPATTDALSSIYDKMSAKLSEASYPSYFSSESQSVPRKIFTLATTNHDINLPLSPIRIGLFQCIIWAASSDGKDYSVDPLTLREASNTNASSIIIIWSPAAKIIMNTILWFVAAAKRLLGFLPDNLISTIDNLLVPLV
ncbi:unnamed protein product, partial [Protopolystoma xenopodis]